jgi:phosphoribosyl-AMP cyclohydrolase
MNKLPLNFRHKLNDEDLIIAITQDFKTCEVLMAAYMNKEALNKTLSSGKVHYWSTTRKKIWLKGETSGNYQMVKEIFVDCDLDSILIKVNQINCACHEGYFSCFFRKIENNKLKIVKERLLDPKDIYGDK